MKRTLLFSLILLSPVVSLSAMTSGQGIWESIKHSATAAAQDTFYKIKDIGAQATQLGKEIGKGTVSSLKAAKDKALSAKKNFSHVERVDNVFHNFYYLPFLPAMAMHIGRKLGTINHNRKVTKDSYRKKLNPYVTLATYAALTPFTYYFSHNYLHARKVSHSCNPSSSFPRFN